LKLLTCAKLYGTFNACLAAAAAAAAAAGGGCTGAPPPHMHCSAGGRQGGSVTFAAMVMGKLPE
jgi:hypothetical protein